jgi:excinuclease UvrABC helicase subunit UvrB
VLSLGTQDIKGGVMVGRNKDIALPSLRYMSETKKVRIEVKTLDIELEKKLVTQIEEEEIVVTGDKLMEVEEDIEMVIPSGKITIQEKIPYFIPKSIPDTIPDTITDAIPTAIPGFIRDTIPDTIPTP